MADVYLTPPDISIRDTQLVLAFLNRAQTPREIAERVEVPNEPDVGVKLAQRILNARAQHNGVFDNLAQVRAVPLIGPERFTEIVTCITGKSALEILLANQRGNLTAESLGVAQQLDTLRQQMDDLQQFDPRRYRIELRALDSTPYLGEIVTLKLRVVDRVRNVSQANMPITLETNWGYLRHSRNYRVQNGAVITARTDADGELTCDLHTPTVEPLTLDQQNELSNALAKLGNAKLLPADMADGFQFLARLYQHPLNRDLRAAIDIHYKSRQSRLHETLNHQAPLHGWVYEQALVRCHLHPHDENERATVLSIAALPLEYRDWLLPWYQLLKEDLDAQSGLDKTLEQTLQFSENELGLTSHVLANLQTFVAAQNGLVAEHAAQQVSQDVVTRFATQNLGRLSSNTRTTLLTLIKEAPATLKSGSAGQIAVANQVAVEVGRKAGVFDFAGTLAGVTGQLGQLQTQVSSMNTRVSNVESATANINFSQLQADLNNFNTNYAAFNQDYTDFSQNYSSFQSDYSTFNSNISGFNNQFATFNTNLQGFNQGLAGFNQSLTNFNQTKDQLVLNVTNGVNAALRTLESNSTTRVTIQPIANVNLTGRVP